MKYDSAYALNNAVTMLLIDKGDVTTKATGFYFSFDNNDSVYLVTNKHVFQNAERLIIPLMEEVDGCLRGYIVDPNRFIPHPSEDIDLAIVEIVDLKKHHHINTGQYEVQHPTINIVQEDMVLTRDETKALNYCEEVLVFGAPNGNCDINNHLLVARKGITATPPSQSYKGRGFMVDVPVSPGASGSPVFWLTDTTMSSFQSTKLLGIINHFHASKTQEANPIYLHLGDVMPGYSLLEFKPLIKNHNYQDKS